MDQQVQPLTCTHTRTERERERERIEIAGQKQSFNDSPGGEIGQFILSMSTLKREMDSPL